LRNYPDQKITLHDAALAIVSRDLAIPVWTFDHHLELMGAQIWPNYGGCMDGKGRGASFHGVAGGGLPFFLGLIPTNVNLVTPGQGSLEQVHQRPIRTLLSEVLQGFLVDVVILVFGGFLLELILQKLELLVGDLA